jgi:hypothetical protein
MRVCEGFGKDELSRFCLSDSSSACRKRGFTTETHHYTHSGHCQKMHRTHTALLYRGPTVLACYAESSRPKNDLLATVQGGDHRSKHGCRGTNNPRASVANISPKRFIAAATRLSACSTTGHEARRQNSFGSHHAGHENPSLRRAKRAALLARH